ncbi:MAG: type II toxin-antitoxin system HicB family antitoxin [Chitinophagaceae bacterium]|nr:type II toxin-antitoxin system HicB family antitoxin [Chitinophagaceae bacterium]
MQKYLVLIEKAESNYSSFSPDVPGCRAYGKSVEETLANMKEALELHIEELDEMPLAKGLQHHRNAGIFKEGGVDANCFVVHVEIHSKNNIN